MAGEVKLDSVLHDWMPEPDDPMWQRQDWISIVYGHGPIKGPLAHQYVQCHGATTLNSNKTGKPFRCSHFVERRRIYDVCGTLEPNTWRCWHHASKPVYYKDTLPKSVVAISGNDYSHWVEYADGSVELIYPKQTEQTEQTGKGANTMNTFISNYAQQIEEHQREIERLRNAEAAAEMERQRVQARIDALREKFGDDDIWPVGTVWTFEHQFNGPSSHAYTYTALKCENGQWYTSGPQKPGPYSFAHLINFIGDADCWFVSEWTKL